VTIGDFVDLVQRGTDHGRRASGSRARAFGQAVELPVHPVDWATESHEAAQRRHPGR
jgi:hypothetical protein